MIQLYLCPLKRLYWQYCIFYLGHVAGQLTAPPPTCPGDIFTFRCTVTGDGTGFIIWRVGESSECPLQRRSSSSSICGPGNVFTARPGSGFHQNGSSFSSILSGTATTALNGILVECFGPANSVDAGNRVRGSNLSIIGQYHKSKCEGAVMHSIYTVFLSVTNLLDNYKATHLTAFCEWDSGRGSLGHPSAADEAWYWPKCILRSGWLYITSRSLLGRCSSLIVHALLSTFNLWCK